MEDHDSFFTQLDGRIAAIEENWKRLKDGWDEERLQSLYQRVCEISESSGDPSLFQLNESAFSLEVYLSSFVDSGKNPSADQLAEIEGLVRGLQGVAGEQPTGQPATPPATARRCTRTFYALLSGNSPAEPLLDYMRAQGCQLQCFEDGQALLSAMNQNLPGLILTDTEMLGELPALSAELTRLSSHQSLDIPLVFISDYSLLSKRVAAMRAGASAYFVTPFEPAAVAAHMQALLSGPDEAQFRVTVVEDDPSQAEFAATILRKGGLEVDVVTDPMTVVDALQSFHPDLILMDIYMPDISGLELTRIIRDFNEFITTPIVFLSGERNSDKQMDALSVGGDDFIAKPIDPRRLLTMVVNRIRRSRKVHAVLSSGNRGRDQVTGLLSHNKFVSHLADVVDELDKDQHQNALLYLRPEALIALQAQIGIGGLDTVIAQAGDRLKKLLGPNDQACRWDDHGLVILLRRPDDDSIEAAAEQIQQIITEQPHPAGLEPIRFSAGLHRLSRGGEDIDNAVQQAIQACGSTAQQDRDTAEPDGRSTPPIPLPIAANMNSILRSALDEDQFGVYYQPLLDLQTRGSENYEILLALTAPDGSTLTWRKLSEHAERAELQQELDRWVLGRALDILIERRNSGRQTQIFVRQSAATAADPAHPQWLAEELQRRGAMGTGLVLDYRLSDLSQDIQACQKNRKDLQELGVQLAISRFVAKPAAYKVLRYLDADYVRVARKLLKADRNTISDVIRQAHKLDARVIVSNVDDPRDIDLHWSSGADYLQGNFIQRPLEDMDYDFSQVVI
jgi:PleD family two-component response regulator/EAL domain-containing protein (putative c-di-GMP-specific phosphodiesterase class I)